MATVEIDEQNGQVKAATLTHNITNTNMGSSDTSNLDPVANPIAPGENSFEKWQLLHVTNMGSSSQIKNIKVWRTGALGKHTIHLTNLRTINYQKSDYSTPIFSNSSVATHIMPNLVPGSANLGIGGSLTGVIIASGHSDFFVHQIKTAKKALAGSTTTMNYSYDEFV